MIDKEFQFDGDKRFSKLFKVVLYLSVFIVISYTIYDMFLIPKGIKKEKEYHNKLQLILNQEFKGFITHKYRDKRNHNAPRIKSKNYNISVIDDIFNIVNKGDSIVKEKNSTLMIVFDKKNKYSINMMNNKITNLQK